MRSISITLIAIALLGLASCQQQSKKTPSFFKDTVNFDLLADMKNILDDNSKDLTLEDVNYLNAAIRYYSPIKDSLLGKTVGELIEGQKERTLKTNINLVQATAFSTLFTQSIKFNIKDFQAVEQENGKPLNVPTYQFQNISGKEIVKLQGVVDYYNGDNLIKRFTVEVDKAIPAEKTLNQPYPYNHDVENKRDVFVRNNFNKLRKVWIPTVIEFADGKVYKRNPDKKEKADMEEEAK
ncbi:MAG: hypothetical protein ACE364_03645 [Chlorobiota bacterium]